MRGNSSYKKHALIPDIKFQNTLVSQFINKIMLSGKKNTAQNLLYKTFENIEAKESKPAIEIFEKAIKNASPLLEVRSKRIGGATYQVPMEVRPERKNALAMRWIINSARSRQGKTFDVFLAEEILDAFHETGTAMKKKEEMHKMAEANKAFAHFARF